MYCLTFLLDYCYSYSFLQGAAIEREVLMRIPTPFLCVSFENSKCSRISIDFGDVCDRLSESRLCKASERSMFAYVCVVLRISHCIVLFVTGNTNFLVCRQLNKASICLYTVFHKVCIKFNKYLRCLLNWHHSR